VNPDRRSPCKLQVPSPGRLLLAVANGRDDVSAETLSAEAILRVVVGIRIGLSQATTRDRVMDSAKLNDWMQVLGIFALVISLIFVGLQMRQDRVLAAVDATRSRSDLVNGLTEMVSDNRELWVSALNGDELSAADQATFEAMIESVESLFFAMWIRATGNDEVLGGSPDAVIDTYAFALYAHSGLRRSWEKQIAYWRARDSALDTNDAGTPWRNLVESELQRLDEAAPPLPHEKRYVFW